MKTMYVWLNHLAIFITSCLAIVPLAGMMGHATEQLAHRMGEGIGGQPAAEPPPSPTAASRGCDA